MAPAGRASAARGSAGRPAAGTAPAGRTPPGTPPAGMAPAGRTASGRKPSSPTAPAGRTTAGAPPTGRTASGTAPAGRGRGRRAASSRDVPVGDDVIPAGLGGVIRFVRRSDVRYAEAHGDYARLYTRTGSHLVRVSLAALEEAWGDAGFVRIHRSHLVALAHVEEMVLESGRCTLRVGGVRLAVSRRNTGALRDRLVRGARPGPL
ncbi:hypothetical protein E1298_06650 [Actinomadura rubrisoli]|uniref:HTH LytTR-type domain-containing protein n=2 Tax=Actinomadura rubrisoli TaxID=2530368 RepID=A0A4R5C947_9ACTN|nr:hypothetical protein E1298_06650 [Actinomadura rubrisoli]